MQGRGKANLPGVFLGLTHYWMGGWTGKKIDVWVHEHINLFMYFMSISMVHLSLSLIDTHAHTRTPCIYVSHTFIYISWCKYRCIWRHVCIHDINPWSRKKANPLKTLTKTPRIALLWPPLKLKRIKVRAFDSDSGKTLWAIENAHKGGVTAIALSHNQRFIMTGGREGDVRLWELRLVGVGVV